MTYDPRQVTETPFGAPLVPRFPLRMRDTEILTVVYRTDAEAADRLLPAPLETLGDLVLVHLYRMHDAEVFGRYGESAVHLPARHPASGTEGAYSPVLSRRVSGSAIAAGREIYGQPKKHGVIEFRLKDGTLVGRLSRDGAPILTVTTAYRETRGAPEDLERHASFRTNINLKVVPAVDGSGAAIRQLTAREFAEVTIREVWKSPAAVEIVPNNEAPLHLLPVRDVLEASMPDSSRIARGLYAANLPGVSVSADEKVSAVLDLKEYAEGRFLLFATKHGMVKKTALPEYASARTGLAAINLRAGDELVDVRLTDGKDEVFLVSRRGQAIRFKESLVRGMGRATGGVIGMRLAEGDEVIALALASDGEEMISVSQNGYGKRSRLADYPTKGRGGKGVIGHQLTRKTGELAGAFIGSKDQDLLTISSSGKVQRVGAADIRRVGRSSQGVRTMRVDDGEHVAAIAPVIIQMDDESIPSRAAGPS